MITAKDIKKAIKLLKKNAIKPDKDGMIEVPLEAYLAMVRMEDWANSVLGTKDKIL